jgi:DNA-binding Lrp family transcriptional regulator
MRKPLTVIDIKILEALFELGPRNLSAVAKKVGISRELLRFRLKRMRENPQFFLRMHTAIYHTNLGLKKAIVVLEAEPGMERLLFDCLLINDFWLYVCRSYGLGEGCTAIYAVPIEHCHEFEEFMHELIRLRVAKNVHVYWTTCFQGGRITPEWFDDNKNQWNFQWDRWTKEIQTQTIELPYTLIEPEAYPVYADELDVRMLEKLEVDATVSFNKLAQILGISPQLARFHYCEHLIGKNLIEGYQIFIMQYGDLPSLMVLFIISFDNYEKFAKFAKSLLNKSFVLMMAKAIGDNTLLTEVFLPIGEFRNFIDKLSELANMKIVRSYKYIIQDLRIRRRQTIFPKMFKEKSWIYDHKTYMTMLSQKVSQFLLKLEQMQYRI